MWLPSEGYKARAIGVIDGVLSCYVLIFYMAELLQKALKGGAEE